MRRSSVFIFAVFALFCSWLNTAAGEEQCLQRAWQAFKARNWQSAIENSDACIDQFGDHARAKQAELTRGGQSCPPVGAVSETEKQKIFGNGLLNDVAVSYWIKGKAAAALKRTSGEQYGVAAREAYENACLLECGRAWDPKGWFWSPCVGARREPEMR